MDALAFIVAMISCFVIGLAVGRTVYLMNGGE